MDGSSLIAWLIAAEVLQLFLVWLYIRQRYGISLRQLARLTAQLAAGKPPASYYIGGTRRMEEVSRNLEGVGAQLGRLQGEQTREDMGLLLANMVEGVLMVDSRHVVRLANDELLRLFGLRQNPVGRTVLEALREAQVEQVLRQTLESGTARREEIALQSSAGAEATRHFEISAVPIRDAAGAIDGAVVVFHDLTRIKHLEVVRRDFVANVSHELRTPLAIFRGYLETLIDNPGLPREDTVRVLESMQRNSNRLNSLVEDLLTLTRLESRRGQTQVESIRVDAFFDQLARDWRQRGGIESAELEWRAAKDLPSLEVDLLRFEQVLLNLLENAVAYSNAPRRIALSAELVGAGMEIRVADNGIGIPPGDLPHIFERFYRVEKARTRSSGGTGLGLAICKHIIEAHGGTIHAESELGRGTTIVLHLPLQRAGEGDSQFIPPVDGQEKTRHD
jgi:two-component system, OmpR family, phosphate regulon sensor histidine kinase PhoR